MKNLNFKWSAVIAVIIASTFITSCDKKQQEQDSTDEMQSMDEREGMDGMNGMDGMDGTNQETSAAVDTEGEPKFLISYMDVKNAMINDNYEEAKKAASDLKNNLNNSELNQQQREKLNNTAEKLAQAQDIEAQRQAFHQLSQDLYQVVKNNKVTNKALYWQHCPMAMNNKGANWLSYQEQVQNPFMGQRMPKCGKVEETIN